jgi:hypothetical protein
MIYKRRGYIFIRFQLIHNRHSQMHQQPDLSIAIRLLCYYLFLGQLSSSMAEMAVASSPSKPQARCELGGDDSMLLNLGDYRIG